MIPGELGAIPKADMHVHLEACARPPLARKMAAKYGESIDDIIAPGGETYVWDGFTGFLGAYSRVANLFRTVEDYAELTRTYCAELGAAGAIHAEIIIWPDHPERLGLSAEDYLDGIHAGIAMHGEPEVLPRLLVTGVRHEGPEAVERAARWAAEHKSHLVAGFGLAGDERIGHPRDFARAFDIAREAGLHLACHAGELSGPDSVRAALDHLKPDRIDHGVRAIEDPNLVERLADEETLLTVCTGSNLALSVFPSLQAHPLRSLMEAGCRIALGSDDPPHFGTSIGHEYALAHHMGLDRDALEGLTRTAIDHSIAEDWLKDRLRKRLDAWTAPMETATAPTETGDDGDGAVA